MIYEVATLILTTARIAAVFDRSNVFARWCP